MSAWCSILGIPLALGCCLIVGARLGFGEFAGGDLDSHLIVVDGKPDEDFYALERVMMTFIAGKRMH